MKTISEIIKKGDTKFNHLVKKLNINQELELVFKSTLDKKINQHCHFANYKNTILTVTVTNSAWATRLRFIIPELIKQLKTQPEFAKITKIRYSIINHNRAKNKPIERPNQFSKDSEALWRQTMAKLKKSGKKPIGTC